MGTARGGRARTWWLSVWVLAAVAGCGTDDAPSTADGAAVDPSSSVPSTTTPPPSATLLVLDQPSVLDLLPDRGDHGTFTIRIAGGEWGQDQHTHTGSYVTTAGGQAYTVIDLDLALVQREVDRLLSMHDRFDDIEPIFADAILSTGTIVTDQLQLGLGDSVMLAGALGAPGLLAVDPWWAYTAVDGGDPATCQEAAAELGAAVRRRLLDESAELGPTWTPDAARLGGQELHAVEVACDGFDPDDETAPGELVIEPRTVRLEHEGEVFFEVTIEPGVGEAPVVDEPRPASLLDRFAAFFLTIDRCGQLPWLYSNFAAANSYHSPDDSSYIGPTPLGEVPVCEGEVSAAARQ